MTKQSMKRIHKVTINRISEEMEECGCCGGYHRPEFSGDCREDAERFGTWQIVFIQARAEVLLPCNLTLTPKDRTATCSFITQRISSGGLGGVETDGDMTYVREVEQEQLQELRGQLHAIRFSTRAITAAFKNVE
jgi:hypothetical protein